MQNSNNKPSNELVQSLCSYGSIMVIKLKLLLQPQYCAQGQAESLSKESASFTIKPAMLYKKKLLLMAGFLLLSALSGMSEAVDAPKDSEAQNDVLNLVQPTGDGATSNGKTKKSKNHIEGEVIVKFKSKLNHSQRQNLHAQNDAEALDEISDMRLSRVKSKKGESTESLIQRYRKQKEVEYAEPNFVVQALALPNDHDFSKLYGLNNTGQTGGTIDADIDAPEAWDIQTGSANIIVAVIDTGTDYNHPDLAANIWTNPGEIPSNGIDDDNNGYVDDVHGWDFLNKDNDPMDDVGHGTHVSGTIAAVGNNKEGVVGVAWRAKIMPLKFLDIFGGSSWNAILAIRYAAQNGAKILNNSWGCVAGTPQDCFSQAVEDAIHEVESYGTLFVAAAGNDSNNNDFSTRGPCDSRAPNAICVAATDHADQLADFSNYGLTRVDIAAPGVDIYSTVPSGPCQDWYCNAKGYNSLSGTSMATPYVSGAAAVILSQFPQLGATQLKQLLTSSGDFIPGLSGKILSGRRLNVFNALQANFVISPSSDEVKANVGETTEFNITLNMSVLNGFIGSVNLSISSPTPEISVSPATAILMSVNGSAATGLTIHVNPTITKGVYILPVTASSSSGETRTTAIVVRVLMPDFDISVSSSSRDLIPGNTANYAVTLVTKDGYEKPVTLSYIASNSAITSGLMNMQPSMTGTAIDVTVATLVIDTRSSLPLGLHTLEIRASDGIKTVSKTVTLNAVSQVRVPNQAWASRVAGVAGLSEINSYLAQGPGGSMYIAGSTCVSGGIYCNTNPDMLLVKLDANGTELWRAVYDYQSEHDEPRAIAVDTNGDVYMVGGFSSTGGRIIKYSGASGAVLWARLDTTISGGMGIAFDATGDVLVMGARSDWVIDDFVSLYVVNKYSPTGALLWSSTYPAGNAAGPRDIKLDGVGNAYVSGHYWDTASGLAADLMLVKFDPSGTVSWAKRYDGGGVDTSGWYSFDTANPVLDIDTEGNIYLSGQSSNGSSDDFVTLKYSPDGVVLWERRFDGGSTDGVGGMRVDGAGNVVVTGYSCQDHLSCSSNYLTVKYNTRGDLLWSNRYDHQLGNDITAALDVDKAGNIYVTGRSADGDYYDYATVKYSPDGQLQWVGRYNATTSDRAEDVLVDSTGNVFVSGKSRNTSTAQDYDFVVVKYAYTDTGPPLNVDLVMTAVSTTASSMVAGNSFMINNTESNQGTINMTVASNTVKFYLSTDATITSTDIELTGTRIVSALAAGENSSASSTVTVPATVGAGTYYIGAIADATNMQPESNQIGNAETNNGLAGGTITVGIPNVDLMMTAVSTKLNNVRVGKSITVSNTIKNQGIEATTASSTVGIYLSTLPTTTSVDALISSSTLIGSRVLPLLAAGATSTADTTATVPSTLATGTYYLWVVADKDKSQSETNEENNALVKAGTIKVNP